MTNDELHEKLTDWLSKKRYTESEIHSICDSLAVVDTFLTKKHQTKSIYSTLIGKEISQLKKVLVNDDEFMKLNRSHSNNLLLAFDQYLSYVCKNIDKESLKRSFKDNQSNLDDYRGLQPTKIVVGTQSRSVSGWNDLLITICELLIRLYPDKMGDLHKFPPIPSAPRTIFCKVSKYIENPLRLSNGYWMRGGLEPYQIMNITQALCTMLRLKQSSIQIVFERDNSLETTREALIENNETSDNHNLTKTKKPTLPQVDFTIPQLCERTHPVSCIISGIQLLAPNWARLLVAITELFITKNNPNIAQLYIQSLNRGHSVHPFIMKNKIDGLNCAQLSNGFWLNINYSIPILVKLIGELCVHCGVDLNDVFITYTPKEDRSLTQSPHLTANCDLIPSIPDPASQLKILCETITRDYPKGFVFSATALRLLSGKVDFIVDEKLQAELQLRMLKRTDGIWFFPDAFADINVQQQILTKAVLWLSKWQFFSLVALYKNFYSLISDNCGNIDDFESFYNYLAKTVPALSNTRTVTWWNMFRIVRAKDVSCDTAFSEISQRHIKLTIDNAGGVSSESDLLWEYPALDGGLLVAVIRDYMPWVIKTEIGGLVCFQNEYHMGLPTDFRDRLAAVINKLAEIGIPVSDDNIHIGLSLEFNVNFCKEYNIPDKKAFRRFIERQYLGEPSRIWFGGVFSEVSG